MIGRPTSARAIASRTIRVYVSRALNPSTAIALAPTSTASFTAARAHSSDVVGADSSAINARTPSPVIDAATKPHASPLPLSDGSTPTTVNNGRAGAAANSH